MYFVEISDIINADKFERLLSFVSEEKQEKVKRFHFDIDKKLSLYAKLIIRITAYQHGDYIVSVCSELQEQKCDIIEIYEKEIENNALELFLLFGYDNEKNIFEAFGYTSEGTWCLKGV